MPLRPRTFLASYCLRNGHRGTLDVIGFSSCHVVIIVMELFGDQFRGAAVRSA
jgi:hypothetical protein